MLLFTPSASFAQAARGAQPQAAPPPAPSNLQILPKTTSRQDVVAIMQGFTQALGVQCVFCHERPPAPPPLAVGAEPAGGGRRGQGPPQPNFAADTNPRKKTARVMMTMVNELNAKLASGLGKPAADTVRVECVTCHRGVALPRQLTDLLWETMTTKGDSAAAEQYRALRQQYFGTQAYDFSERVLVSLAQRSLAASKIDDASAFLQLNLEFYPKSSSTYVTLSQLHLKKNDTETAIKDLEMAVQLDPGNAQARRQLDELKK